MTVGNGLWSGLLVLHDSITEWLDLDLASDAGDLFDSERLLFTGEYARLALAGAHRGLGRDALPLIFLFFTHRSILDRAVGLPFAEHVEGKCAEDRAELSFLAVRVLVNDHVDFEHLANGIPEVSRLVEAPVV